MSLVNSIKETSVFEAGAAAAASLDFRDEIPEPTGIVLVASRSRSCTGTVKADVCPYPDNL
jgi:hypothetical protein